MPRATPTGEQHPNGCWCGECQRVEEPASAGPQEALDGGAGSATAAKKAKVALAKATAKPTELNHRKRRKRGVGSDAGQSFEARTAEYLALKALNPKLSMQEAADKIGVNRRTLYEAIQKSREAGLLDGYEEEPLEKLKFQIIPKVVENLNEFIQAKDKQVTLETAKHTIFKSYQQAEGLQDQTNMVLAIKIEPADPGHARAITGEVLGVGRVLDSVEVE